MLISLLRHCVCDKTPHECFRLFFAAATVALLGMSNKVGSAATVEFSKDVRPILSDKCFKCHGPDAESREADLRLDVRDAAEHVLDQDDSELLRRITSDDPDEQMPPPGSKIVLTPSDQQVLREWIKSGANYAQHWSFEPIRKPQVPDASVDLPGWDRPVAGFPTMNAIDRFLAAALDARELAPQSQASRERLIRRLTFDLTGLPPTISEIDDFLGDESPGAYEKLVDRLLARETFGERIASDWLDAARYSDTYGYQVDRDRFVWPWRDWLIRAVNANLPYDEFITWQLAGDLLPNATDDQILATTFNRLHPQKVEGGSVPEEFRIEYVADRNHTFATAFLGLTLECCRCHDHKYDPISQREYYQFFAFFNNIDEAGLYSYFTDSIPTPTKLITTNEQNQQIQQLLKASEIAEENLAQVASHQHSAFRDWLLSDPTLLDQMPGQIAHRTFEDGNGANETVEGKKGSAVKLTGDDGIGLGVGNFKRSEPFSIAFWMNTPDLKERAVVFHRSRAWTDAGSRGYQMLLENGKLSASLIHFWPGNAIRVRTKTAVPTGQWLHVTMTYDGSSSASGLKLFVDGASVETEVVRDNLYKNITGGGGDNISIGERFRDRGFTDGLIDEFRVFERELTASEIREFVHEHVLDDQLAAAVSAAKSSTFRPDDHIELYEYYLAVENEPFREAVKTLQQARQAHNETADSVQEIMVMREMPTRRQTFVLNRGMYDSPTEAVEPETPSALPPFPEAAPRNRLGLAQWLTSPDNPLTARVAVNRFWNICFGRGLVTTPEDFGSQGAAPTNPDLLDWLAADFVENGWNVKRLLKQMVMSSTYRQRSTVVDTEARNRLIQVDPENSLLARAPRYRLSAEMIRDNALASSGLLVGKIGGPSAKPYEVSVSFKPIGHDEGDGLYRRSLYTFWKRTAPAPVMMTLDASKRDVCTVKRERTASPLQAFVLLNDPQFVEASRCLAERLMTSSRDLNQIIERAFRVLTSRNPSQMELKLLCELYGQQVEYFSTAPKQATNFLKTGQHESDPNLDPTRLAALTVVTNTIMNLDECVTKR